MTVTEKKAAGYMDGAVLLGYQAKWDADRSDVKVCEKSRQVGMSWTEAGDDALLAASAREAGGMNVWYMGYNKDMALEFIQDCAFWAAQYQLAAEPYEECVVEDTDENGTRQIQAYRIVFASGFRVTALSSRPTNWRGKRGKAVIDEAAFHDDLPGLLKAVMALLMWGGRVVIISTHNGDNNPFNDLVNDIRAGKRPYSLHRITLDDALADGLYRRICQKLGQTWSPDAEADWRRALIKSYGDAADEELLCIPSQGSGAYLPRTIIEQCMREEIPVVRWTCEDAFALLPDATRQADCEEWCKAHLDPILATVNPDWPTVFGEDFARSGDLTSFLPAQRQPDLVWRTICDVELRNVPFRQQEQVLFYLVDRLPNFRAGAMDGRGNGQYLAEVAQQRYGTSIYVVMLSTEWYREHMPRYKSALEDRTFLLPKHADVLDDHRLVKMDKGVAKVPDNAHTDGSDGKQRHGDTAIAGALASFATVQEWGAIEFEAAGVKRDFVRMDGFVTGVGAGQDDGLDYKRHVVVQGGAR